jgi:hypothetical protein
VIDLVGEKPLSEETLVDVRLLGEDRVKDLDRHALSVAVGGLIDSRHPSDADKAVEMPLVVQKLADAGVDVPGERVG